MLLYTDPWKDDPYGKIQGEMVNVWSKLTFEEAKLYKHDDAYILAGYFHAPLLGVTRKFKPENAIDSGLMSVTIHSQDYQVRKKNDEGKYETVTYKASIHEKLLYQHITDNPSQWLDPNQNLKGAITFLPDDNYKGQSNPQLPMGSCEIEQIEPTGKLPQWQPPKSKSNSNWGNGKGISLEDKTIFLRKELTETILDDSFKAVIKDETPLSYLITKVVEERQKEETFLVVYFDLLKALLESK